MFMPLLLLVAKLLFLQKPMRKVWPVDDRASTRVLVNTAYMPALPTLK